MSKLILAAAAALVFAGPAFAQESLYALSIDTSTPAQAVSTRDVDFRDPASVQHLYGKLWDASYAVCNTSHVNMSFDTVDRICVRDAMDSAVRVVNHRTLSAMYKADRPAVLAFN